MNRRRLVTALGTGIATVSLGAASLVRRGAAANVRFSAGRVRLSNDSGDVERVFVRPTGRVRWRNFDQPVTGARLTFRATVPGRTGWKTVHDERYALFEEGKTTGRFRYTPERVGEITLYEGTRANELFGAERDGETREETVRIAVRVTLLAASGRPARPTDEAQFGDVATLATTAVNEGATVSASGRANGGIE
ncbi:hypothetical protein [Halomarina pelagica]|uniref:hypothetical protein n=1 Tax=Halomarina pelagica TaxID=2961599 RepID=UPI0020C2CCF0|nr:hypothetical protein [Halomarina sp. BND7]